MFASTSIWGLDQEKLLAKLTVFLGNIKSSKLRLGNGGERFDKMILTRVEKEMKKVGGYDKYLANFLGCDPHSFKTFSSAIQTSFEKAKEQDQDLDLLDFVIKSLSDFVLARKAIEVEMLGVHTAQVMQQCAEFAKEHFKQELSQRIIKQILEEENGESMDTGKRARTAENSDQLE